MILSTTMYVYSITCPLTLTKSLAAILNLPTNLFYLLDSVLALTSENFPSIHPSRNPLVATFINSLVTQSLRVFSNIYSLPIDKDGRACRNISIQFLCVYSSVISSISGKSFHFPFPYFVIFILRYFPFHVVFIYNYVFPRYLFCSINKNLHEVNCF